MEPGEWAEGKFVIVEHGPGDYRETRHGLRFLVGGEAILLDPERHAIIGVAVERREGL